MNKDRGAEIKQRQQQNKRLEQQTKRMEQELQKIKKIKQIENQKIKLEQQMKELSFNKQKKEPITEENKNLRGYGIKVAQKNTQKIKKKIQKLSKKYFESSQSEDNKDQEDGENLKYFLEVMGMTKYFLTFKENKILTLEKLKAVKESDLKNLGIPLKDMVVINKKLRAMGIN